MMKFVPSFIKSLLGKEELPELPSGISRELVLEYRQSRPKKQRKTFCYAPSANMLFSQDGSVKACCHNTTFVLGKYPEQSIKEIWQSEAANEFREKLAKYDLSTGCDVCVSDFNIRSFGTMPAAHFDYMPLHKEYPIMMEFLMSNQCNLECIMCKGEYSSLIRKNREKLPPIPTAYDSNFLKQLEEFIPYLQETRFSGSGEAFSIDMNYEIWELIIKMNPKCLIVVQTNGTILTARVKEIMSRGNFQIGVSLDSLKKDVFEEIRVNANWDKVMQNIQYFHEYSIKKGERFSISTCVMRQNWSELPEFIRFCNGMDALATFHKVWFPQEMAVHNLPYATLKEIYETLSAAEIPAGNTYAQRKNKQHYEYHLKVIKGWVDTAHQPVLLRKKLQALSAAELHDYITGRLTAELKASDRSAQEQQQVLSLCLEKIAAILDRIGDKDRLEAMQNICMVPASDMLPALQFQPLEILYEQAAKYFAGEPVM